MQTERILKEDILGFQVVAQPPEACVDEVFECLEHEGRKARLACLNPHSYAVALDDADFAGALRSADWLVPDGVGVVLASRLLGGGCQDARNGIGCVRGASCADERPQRNECFLSGCKRRDACKDPRAHGSGLPGDPCRGHLFAPLQAGVFRGRARRDDHGGQCGPARCAVGGHDGAQAGEVDFPEPASPGRQVCRRGGGGV